MPQTKYNCPSCRRLVDITSPCCPYCKTPNSLYKKTQSSTKEDNSKDLNLEVADDVGEELFDDFNIDNKPSAQNAKRKNTNVPDVNGMDDADSEYILPKKNLESVSDTSTAPSRHSSDSLSSQSEEREKIQWSDEKKKSAASDPKDMYNTKGEYNANHDGYYDDILPKISDEVDKILLNKEKTILKIIGAVVIIFGIIVYLVVTLN